jgi:uncharacterized membrane protein YgdD (TMEM256/DUF423 family)
MGRPYPVNTQPFTFIHKLVSARKAGQGPVMPWDSRPRQTVFVFVAELSTLLIQMKSKSQILLIAAGLLGFVGVALGAFGAHGLRETLETSGQLKHWEKAVFYQLIHAAALLALTGSSIAAASKIGLCWIGGVACFSGSLYWLALGGPVKLLWPVTPLGGLALLTGWAWLIWSAFRQKDA